MKIHIFAKPHFWGLHSDKEVLTEELTTLGHEVEVFLYPALPTKKGDINIHIENINTQGKPLAHINWLIPNPEWLKADVDDIKSMDLILCKTHEAKRIFDEKFLNAVFLGFTSHDHYIKEVEKDYRSLFHYQGGTGQRGTFWLERAWANDLEQTLPLLTIISFNTPPYEKGSLRMTSKWLPPEKFYPFQNSCGIHLFPSCTEGFGHTLNEGRATASVVITLDAPPMNELVTDRECLLPIVNKSIRFTSHFANLYFYDPRDMVKMVQKLVSWPKEKLQEIGQNNRKRYLQEREEFRERLKKILSEVKIDKDNE